MAMLFTVVLVVFVMEKFNAQDLPCPDCNIPGYYTCYEQNKWVYAGYRDPEYRDNTAYPQYVEGDVCNHESPTTGEMRNICRFQVHKSDCSNSETQYQTYTGTECSKTWSWKCSSESECPDGWEESSDGCVEVNNGQMIVCCCRGDLCNGEQYLTYSIQGWTDQSLACNVVDGKCDVSNAESIGMNDIMDYPSFIYGNENQLTYTQFLVLNVLVSMVTCLLVLCVVLTCYYCMKKCQNRNIKRYEFVNQEENIDINQ